MNTSDKSKQELIREIQELKEEIGSLKKIIEKNELILQDQDFTAQKSSEHALEESVKEYKNLIEISPIAMCIIKDWHTIYFNPAAIHLFGAESEQEIVGKHILELVHPDFHELINENSKYLA